MKPMLEILAGVPTVVYGFFAALTVAPACATSALRSASSARSDAARRRAGHGHHDHPVRLLDGRRFDRRGPAAMRDGAAWRWARPSPRRSARCILPAALPGIVGGVLLAVSRAIGETMIVVMAAGLSANLTANPLER